MRRLFLPLAALVYALTAPAAPARQAPPDNPYGLHAGGGVGLRPPAGFTVGPRLKRYRSASGDKSRQAKGAAKNGSRSASGASRRQPAQPAE